MAALDHSQGKLARDLIDQVVKALVAENSLLRDDSNRIRRITSEAAGTLRRKFKEVDGILKQQSGGSASHRLQFQQAYGEIISALQFEDIVSQVIGHQLERSEITLTILMQIEDQLRTPGDSDTFEQRLGRLGAEVDLYLSRLSASESVKQQNLAVGETELF